MLKRLFLSLILLAAVFSAVAQNNRYLLDGLEAPVYYGASKPLEEGSSCHIAIIVIHGWGGGVNPGLPPGSLRDVDDGVFIVCPCFPTYMSMEKAGVEPDGRALWNQSWSRDLTKKGRADDDWRGGGDAAGLLLSSFDVIDIILAKFADKSLYPNLKRVVLSGFSAGGQFVSRYVAVGRGSVRRGVEVEYAAMSPSTFLRFDAGTSWHYGLEDRPRYSRALSKRKILKNLSSRRMFCGCGDQDVNTGGALDKTPEAMAQGENRFERYCNFVSHTEAWPKWRKQLVTHTFEGISHESSKAYCDPALLDFLGIGR